MKVKMNKTKIMILLVLFTLVVSVIAVVPEEPVITENEGSFDNYYTITYPNGYELEFDNTVYELLKDDLIIIKNPKEINVKEDVELIPGGHTYSLRYNTYDALDKEYEYLLSFNENKEKMIETGQVVKVSKYELGGFIPQTKREIEERYSIEYYENGDIKKKWDYTNDVYTEYYHDDFIKKVEVISTGKDITEGVKQEFGSSVTSDGEFTAEGDGGAGAGITAEIEMDINSIDDHYLSEEEKQKRIDNINKNIEKIINKKDEGDETIEEKGTADEDEESGVQPKIEVIDENKDEKTITLKDNDGNPIIISEESYNYITNVLGVDGKDISITKDEDETTISFTVSNEGGWYTVDIGINEDGGIDWKLYTQDLGEGKIRIILYDSDNKKPIINEVYESYKDDFMIKQEEMEKIKLRLEYEKNLLNELVEKYKEEGKEGLTDEELKILKILGNKAGEDLTYEQKKIIEHASQTFADVFYNSVRAARRGIALSNLLNSWLDWDFMMGWRKKSDEFFSQTVIGRIISGKWEESICHKHIDNIPNNVAVVNVNNMMGFAAHVEGERSKQITTNNQTIYFYKITFAVNPQIDEDEEIEFELLIDGNKADLDNDGKADKIELKPGESYSGTGENAIVRYKDEIYEKVCLKFYDTENLNAEFRNSLKDDKLCNNIVEAYISPGEISEPASSTTVSSTSTGQQGW